MARRMKGLEDLGKKLAALPAATRAKVKDAARKGAEDVVATARGLAPVHTGELRDSIKMTEGDAPGVKPRPNPDGAEAIRYSIYSASPESRWVEFGTAAHIAAGEFAGAHHPGTTGRPFFYPAWRSNQKRIRSRIARAVRLALKQVAGTSSGASGE